MYAVRIDETVGDKGAMLAAARRGKDDWKANIVTVARVMGDGVILTS